MKIALLVISTASLICSAGTLLIAAKVAHEAQNAKAMIDAEIETLRQKVARNAKVVKAALSQLEI